MKFSRVAGRRAASGSPCSSRASTPARKPETFERERRITRGAQLRGIARAGKRLRSEHFDVRAVASLSRLEHARIGLVVPKHGRSAVARNRLKRRLRELCRTLMLPGAPPLDVVIHARPSAYRVTFDELEKIIRGMTGQLPRLAERLSASKDSSDAEQLVSSDDPPSV